MSDNKAKNFDYLLVGKLKNIGSEYRWYIDYQIAINEEKKNLKFLEKSIIADDLFLKDKYFDLANFYRIKKDYKLALDYYEKIEKLNLDLDWTFYYFKGVCHERLDMWDLSEKI